MEAVVLEQEGYVGISSTHVTMLDSIYDPFGTPTDELSLLNFEKFTEYYFPYDNPELEITLG